MNLLDKVQNYVAGVRILTDWLGSGAEVVEPEVAKKRATACIHGDTNKNGKPCKCRYNEKGGILAKAIAWSVHEQVSLKNDLDLKLDEDAKLHQCSICSCQLKLKIWVPIEKLRAEELPEEIGRYPDWCWMKTE